MKRLQYTWFRRLACLIITLQALAYSGNVFAIDGENEHHTESDSEEFNPAETILHHVMDDYQWHFVDWKDDQGHEHHVTIPLPIILITEGNFDVFMSSAFYDEHHQPKTHSVGDRTYQLSHGHIEEIHGKSVLDFSFTKNAAAIMISAILLIVIFNSVLSGYKKRPNQSPKGIQSLMEVLIIFIRDEVAKPSLGKKTDKFLPYLLTLFFFIWFNNVLGLFPGAANASGNIAFTFILALFTYLITTFSGNKDYWKHIFATPGVPKGLLVVMIPVEILGTLTKPFALMMRLFANITAGHIVILSFVSLTFIFKNAFIGLTAGLIIIPMMFLELFVAILQAYIFTQLTALFIGMAVEEHDHH